jgi:hypothetical protein
MIQVARSTGVAGHIGLVSVAINASPDAPGFINAFLVRRAGLYHRVPRPTRRALSTRSSSDALGFINAL